MKPKKIFHCGDVHIFFSKKFEAHEYVFNEFYKEIERESPQLIVIAGDLIDSKSKLSPEQIHLARTFLLNITNHCPVLMILGNHDTNLANKDRLDSLSPIVYSLNNETIHPIHFFKHSGVYELYDIKWAIWSCLDDQQKPIIIREKDDYVIGLYHGSVKGCLSDNGFPLMDGIDVEEFNECDRVMLADIHARQTFRNDEIVYCGSTIQTKISEPAKGSYVIWTWDGKNYNYEFKDLGNIYSTITETIDNIDSINIENKTQHLVIKYDSLFVTKTEVNQIKKTLQAKHGIKVEMKPLIKKKVRRVMKEEEIKAQKKIDLQNAMKEYLEQIKLSNDDIKSIMELDALYSANLDLSKDFELGDYSLKQLTVSNFLSFKPTPQLIDFDKEGIIGIGGKNRVGKSSIIKAIIFCLYNSSPDNNASLKKLINKHNRNQESHVELVLEKNGLLYKIVRTLIPKKKEGVTTILTFAVIDENDDVIKNLTGEKRQDTEKEIQRYFGIESAFEILSLYSAQKRQQELIDCKNAERLKLINKFIGLQSYESKLEAVNEDLKALKAVYQNVSKDFNQSVDITQMESELIKLSGKEITIKEDISDLQESERIYEFKNRHLVSNYELLKKLSNKSVADPAIVKIDIEKIQEAIKEREIYKLEVENALDKFRWNREEWANKLKTEFNKDITKYKIDYKITKNEENRLAVIKAESLRLISLLESNVCSSCGSIYSASAKEKIQDKINELEVEGIRLSAQIYQSELIIKSIEEMKEGHDDAKDKIEQCENELRKIDGQLKNYKIQIENLQLKTKDWDDVQSAKEKLDTIEKEYQKHQSYRKDASKSLDMLQNELGSCHTKIKLLQKDIDLYKTQYIKLQETEEKIRVHKSYKDIVNKDGLPLFILKSKIDDINEQVNLIVSQVFDFEVEFSVDEQSGELNVEFFYEGDDEKNDVGFASGSETFIINLCIKVGLSQVSELPKMTSLLIDEGYGTLDKDTVDKIPALFATLPEYYKNIITVSHIDELKDLYQYEIKLIKTNKYTEILN